MILHAERMYGVKPELVSIVLGAGQVTSFVVTEGLRTHERQVMLVAQGKSQTLNSKHLRGEAVDLAVCDGAGAISWDFEEYRKLANIMRGIAMKHGVPIVWGGDWKSLKDGPHFELTDSHTVEA